MGKYGYKIRNMNAAMVYETNIGVRDYFTYTDAMLNNSLFSYFIEKNGLNIYKDESTRDIICLNFEFGCRSYDNEVDRINKLLKNKNNRLSEESIENLKIKLDQVHSNKEKYQDISRGDLRIKLYEEGIDVTYTTVDKKTKEEINETIHYKMLFRTSAKAKLGQVMFINEKLYDIAYDWLTMGLGNKMPKDNAMIVEMSAYAPLTTSTIIATTHIPVEDILILKDQDSFFKTIAKVVKAKEYETKNRVKRKQCIVEDSEVNVKNTLWDGMMLAEPDVLPTIEGNSNYSMALFRNHMFKACAFKCYIQKFFKDWCNENGYDYNTHQVQDMFGNMHYLKDIKMITTDNAIKWKKFASLMGDTLQDAYKYWCDRVNKDGSIWGIVKIDHPSKLGSNQQLSYQMINTLPCNYDDVSDICSNTVHYVESLKKDNNVFIEYLKKNQNITNNFDMLIALYEHNIDFANSTYFRKEKSDIIKKYVHRLRKGKITVNGDNLTFCGNPYALLLYSVGEDWNNDKTMVYEEGSIQCYTTKFQHDEYLCAFRNPHNSPNNVCHLHNVYSDEMETYFPFTQNIIAINCIGTDIQARANGMDEDSDFVLVTNQPTMVRAAKECYKKFPTIVNDLSESGITYKNTMTDYANMDNKLARSRMGIGYSSNLAQLAMTYYWTELSKENPDEQLLKDLYDNFIILSVLAQIIIDGCKREYEIDGNEETTRISNLSCMSIKKNIIVDGKQKEIKYDFPAFMKYTRSITTTKNGKLRNSDDIKTDKEKLERRINTELICPMNYMEDRIDKIQMNSTKCTVPTKNFFIKYDGRRNERQMSKIVLAITEYDNNCKVIKQMSESTEDSTSKIIEETEKLLALLRKIKISNIATINRLIELSLGIEKKYGGNKSTYNVAKHSRNIMSILYKMNPERFLENFKKPI